MAAEFSPLIESCWKDLEALFGPRGACAGCWCMGWRLPKKTFSEQAGEGNHKALRELVASGAPVGVLGYVDGVVAGWCALAPRQDYPALARSRILKPVDDKPVWSVTCFFVRRGYRHQGLTVRLLQAAAEYARAHGANILEGYPTDPGKKQPDAFVYTGLAPAFRKAGFVEVARRSPSRPIMRLELSPQTEPKLE